MNGSSGGWRVTERTDCLNDIVNGNASYLSKRGVLLQGLEQREYNAGKGCNAVYRDFCHQQLKVLPSGTVIKPSGFIYNSFYDAEFLEQICGGWKTSEFYFRLRQR